MSVRGASAAWLALGVFIATAPAAAQTPASAPKVVRHLVYGFTYGDVRNISVHNSGFNGSGTGGAGSGSGVDSYTDRAQARGDIDVDVLGEQADKGLVMLVSEQADNVERNAKPVECVVYGLGNVTCDPHGVLNPEEYSVIRLLGVGFVNPAIIDDKNHWHLANDGAKMSMTSDYTILKNDNGVLDIDENRRIAYHVSGGTNASVNSSIGYDLNRDVMLSLNEVTVDHPLSSGQEVDNTVTVTAKLQTDSMAAAKP
jgi:hypothetical protein